MLILKNGVEYYIDQFVFFEMSGQFMIAISLQPDCPGLIWFCAIRSFNMTAANLVAYNSYCYMEGKIMHAVILSMLSTSYALCFNIKYF